jgi:hypothetical protein
LARLSEMPLVLDEGREEGSRAEDKVPKEHNKSMGKVREPVVVGGVG